MSGALALFPLRVHCALSVIPSFQAGNFLELNAFILIAYILLASWLLIQ